MLNRTIVVPPFFKHDRTDKTIQDNGNLVNPWDRIDFESLSKISSLAPNLYFVIVQCSAFYSVQTSEQVCS